MKNPLYDKMGRFQWDAFWTLFSLPITLAAGLIAGTIANAMWPGAFIAVGIFASTFAAYLIFGVPAIVGWLVVVVGLSVGEHTLPIIAGLVAGIMLGVIITLTTTYTSPFSRFIARLKREKEFGRSIG